MVAGAPPVGARCMLLPLLMLAVSWRPAVAGQAARCGTAAPGTLGRQACPSEADGASLLQVASASGLVLGRDARAEALQPLLGGSAGSAATVAANVVPVTAESKALLPGALPTVAVGLCSSGGGSRALSFFTGAVRALTNLGLMPHVDALSAVSGSSWASIPYMFADRTTAQLLGAATLPGALTLDFLQLASAEIGVAATRSINGIVMDLLLLGTPPHEAWQKTIGKAILEPFGLNSPTAYVASSAANVARIVRNNPTLAKATFHVPQPGRPSTYVVLGTLLAPCGYNDSASSAVGFQMSPDYTGVPFYPDGTTVSYMPSPGSSNLNPLDGRLVGGGLVETFAFGGSAPQAPWPYEAGTALEVGAPAVPFTLADAAGISSWSEGARLANTPLRMTNPRSRYWPLASAEAPEPQEAMEYLLSDGGNIDNSGLLPLLQRGAQRVVWLAAVYKGLNMSYPWARACGSPAGAADFDPVAAGVIDQLLDKFGYGAEVTDSSSFFLHNQVFAQSELPALACRLWSLVDAGKPAVVSFTSTVLANTWWGLAGGVRVEVLLVYLEKVAEFNAALPPDTQAEIAKGAKGMFANFPIYNTMFQNFLEPTSYTMRQVNLLAALAEYNILQSEQAVREFFAAPTHAS